MAKSDTKRSDIRKRVDWFDLTTVEARWLAGHSDALKQICKLLEVDLKRRSKVLGQLFAIAIEHGQNLVYADDLGRAKKQKIKIAQLVTSLLRTRELLQMIDSDFRLIIGGLTRETSEAGQTLSLANLDADSERVIDSAQTFLRRYKPSGIKTNIALECAVSALINLIENELGQSISFSEKGTKQTEPKPLTDGAKAMAIFLQAIGPKTTMTSIYNMVERARKNLPASRLPFEELVDVECLESPGTANPAD